MEQHGQQQEQGQEELAVADIVSEKEVGRERRERTRRTTTDRM